MDGPDLSSLPRDVRVRFAVAVYVYRATWDRRWDASSEQVWSLQMPNASFHDVLAYAYADGRVDYEHLGALSDYPTDPDAWGPLMEKELVRWESGEWGETREHRCAYVSDDGVSIAWGRWQPTLGAAVVRAVLQKHGVEID